MTNKEKVKQIYPTAFLYQHAPDLWIVYHTISNKYGSVESILGISTKSIPHTWKLAWKECQQHMVTILEK